MPRDKIVSWPTWLLFVLAPPLALVALVCFPLTLIVVFWLYYRGKRQARAEQMAGRGPTGE